MIVLAALAAATIAAWVWLFSHPMSAMQPEPISVAYLPAAFLMWAIMMVAMMVPSATPMVLLRARMDKAPSALSRIAHTVLFAFAYILIWVGFSAVAALTQALLVRAGELSPMHLSLGSRVAAGGILLIAAVYEMTAAKRLCLEKCQSPLLFMLRHFRPGAAGAVRLGLLHGLFCLGCCWALMLLLFVGGVMNLAWVAVLGVIVLGEKLLPPRFRAERYVAAGLAISGIAVLAT
jgi:predicted metal-binding membrane protein